MFHDPALHGVGRVRVLKLAEDSRPNQNAVEESRQEIRLIDEDEVVQRRRVGKDDRADDRYLWNASPA